MPDKSDGGYRAWKLESDAYGLYLEARDEIVQRHTAEMLSLIDASYDFPADVRNRAFELASGSPGTLVTSVELDGTPERIDINAKN